MHRLLRLVPLLLVMAFVAAPMASAFAADVAAQRGIPRRALWIEVSANLRTLASREAIRAMIARARSAGIDTLIPEAKNAWGFVIYESAFAPHIRTSPLPRPGYPAPAEWYPKDFDPLQAIIEEAHAAGLRVHPAVNTFGEGVTLDRTRPTLGLVHSRPEWESVHLRPSPSGDPALVPSSSAVTIAFVNPAHPEVQLYELAVLWEIVSRYDVDGIILDRVRYPGVDADFSDLSRARFEAFLGRRVSRWPHEVLQPAGGALRPGPLFPAWVAWRASVIQAYVRAASRLIRQMRPGIPVGMYVGAWYPTIFEFGQNWAHPEAPRLFPAWTDAWAQASLLPLLDYLMIG
ncbi:MAG: family 10 glycosylhydrolase, partial [bacterium]